MNFLSLLTLLFIGLKLAGVIVWSWWLVLLPLYFPFALVGLISGKKPRLTLAYKGKRIW